MLFSSVLFLFYFLPATLAAHALLPRAARNYLLLAASLFFYAWGELAFVGILLASIALNHGFGLLIDCAGAPSTRRAALITAITANLGLLAAFKYANFAVDNLNPLLIGLGLNPIALDPVALPLGISFFTFQAMSYVIDVYRGTAAVQKNPATSALYIALFPQLVAGPIVRYHDIARELVDRRVTAAGFASGIRRFTIGLGKKILIANNVAIPADAIFALPDAEITPALAWFAVLCYTLQIYFDFSGYSDMAIGLGRMLGFQFLENFNYPYIARSVRDFWRRWHISLSNWFRDYLYIPLGGNRFGLLRTGFNLVAVFFLCGLWHGAAWNFVLWGLYHGLFLVFERTRFGDRLDRAPAIAARAYTLLVVMIGWVLFRAESLAQARAFFLAMLGLGGADSSQRLAWHIDALALLAVAAGILGALPWAPRAAAWSLQRRGPMGAAAYATGSAACIAVLALCAMSLAAQTHNPFIYFRF